MVLLVVDMQKGIFDERLYAFDRMRANVATLLAAAREHGVEAVFVRHDDGPGTGFSIGDDEFAIYEQFAPQSGEKVFDKMVNSALHSSTGLHAYLTDKGVHTVMIVGLQTDYCIDATIKTGFDLGYTMLVPAYANSTVDNCFFDKETAYRYYNELIWPGRYAQSLPVEQAVALLAAGGAADAK